MTLKNFLDLYDDWNGYTQINDRNCNPYARVKTDHISNGNYNHILNCKVMAFGFYDGDLCVRIDYEMNAELKGKKVYIVMIHGVDEEKPWIHSVYNTRELAEQVCADLNNFFNGEGSHADFISEEVRENIEEED